MMKCKLLRTSVLAAAMAGALMTAPAHAVEYVVNGGFETGNLNGWNLSPDIKPNDILVSSDGGYPAGTGTYLVWAEPPGPMGYISQTLATSKGEILTISGYYLSYGGGSTEFLVALGDTILLDDNTHEDSGGWKHFSYTVTGKGNDVLKIGFLSLEWISLDNVSVTGAGVTETPLPATLPLFASGLGALGLLARRRIKRAA